MPLRRFYSLKRLTSGRRNHWLPLAGLIAYVLAKGIVPAGFMPGSLADGSLYTLCHDDRKSVAVLALLDAGHASMPDAVMATTDHHHGDHHTPLDAAPAPGPDNHQSFPDGNCDFANSVAHAILTLAFDVTPEVATPPQNTFLATRAFTSVAYIRPLTRAPPRQALV